MTGSIMVHDITGVKSVTVENVGDEYEVMTVRFTDKNGDESELHLFSVGKTFEKVNTKIKRKYRGK